MRLFRIVALAFAIVFAVPELGRRLLLEEPILASPPKKIALLIGISKYDRGGAHHEDTDWWDLQSERDVNELSNLLSSEKFGFENIKILKTSQDTTHKAIVDAFRNWLIPSTDPGDIVFIHYSGHGSQAPDTDTPDNPIVGDEFSGLDETIVPSDYITRDDPSRDIRDDEIGILLRELNARHPAQVFLSFDTCHAGSITRGRLIARGRKWQGPKPTPTAGTKYAKTRGGILRQDEATSRGYVVLEASRDDQLAHQYPDSGKTQMGLLTYALVKVLGRIGPNTTYRDIFDQVSAIVTSVPADQDPQIEGEDVDNVFLSTIKKPRQTYLSIQVGADGGLMLKGGMLQDVTKGSTYSLYSAQVDDVRASAPTAIGIVKDVDLGSATVEVNGTSTATEMAKQLAGGKAVEKLHNYGDNRIRLDASLIHGLPNANATLSQLGTLPLVNLADYEPGMWDVRICPDQCPATHASAPGHVGGTTPTIGSQSSSLIVQRADGSTLAEIPSYGGIETLKGILERESRWLYVNSLRNEDPSSGVAIDLRIVPVEVQTDAPCGTATQVLGDEAASVQQGRLILSECDYVMLEVKNSGSDVAFVSVLDLQSNGSIGALWPQPQADVHENHIDNDKKWHRIPYPYVFKITKPYGREVFKAVATKEPTDFGLVVEPRFRSARPPRPNETKAMNSPLGRLLTAAAMGTRGGGAIDPSDWSTATVVFDVQQQSSRPTDSGAMTGSH